MEISVGFLNVYICFIFLAVSNATQNASKPEMGPYKTTVVRSERCRTPQKPYDKNPDSYFSSEIYTSGKKILLRGNLTIVRLVPHLWLSAKGLIQENGTYQTMYVANAAGCNGLLIRLFKIALNVQHYKGCLPKGTYLYKDMDFNAIQQTWSHTTKYGSYLWRFQVGTRTGTSVCWEYHTETTPL